MTNETPEPDAARGARGLPSHIARAAGSGALESRMVDVSEKPVTRREATAMAHVRFPRGVLAGLLADGGPKGPITEVSRTAGVMAAKRTADWIPLCHPLGLDAVEVEFEQKADDLLEIRCRAACTGRTGVEMEAMVGVAAAALTVYDMTKGIDHGIAIEGLRLVHKRGGRSGEWRA